MLIICSTHCSLDLRARGGTVPGKQSPMGQLAYRNTMLPPPKHTPAGEQGEGGGAVKTAVLQLRGEHYENTAHTLLSFHPC